MSVIHIFRAPSQPATRWKIDRLTPWVKDNPNKVRLCVSCGKPRRLRNMRVRAYYDTVHYFCARGGCVASLPMGVRG